MAGVTTFASQFINGNRSQGSADAQVDVIDPATGQTVAMGPASSAQDGTPRFTDLSAQHRLPDARHRQPVRGIPVLPVATGDEPCAHRSPACGPGHRRMPPATPQHGSRMAPIESPFNPTKDAL
jgi:hypothetical protein